MSTIQFSHIAITYNQYLDSLYAYALHLGFDDHTCMDAIHDVFYKLCINLEVWNTWKLSYPQIELESFTVTLVLVSTGNQVKRRGAII